jgi:hypothetical protein
MVTTTKIPWNTAHYLWSDFKLGDAYKQYLFDTYGITVESGGRVIWDHVLTVEVVIETMGGAGEDYRVGDKKEKQKKKIKLIFIMGELRSEQEKEVSDLVTPEVISDIKNKIQEQTGTKISLSDVQIIKG